MSGKRRVKRNMMVIVLALLVIGSVGVAAAYERYTFYIDLNNREAYSEPSVRTQTVANGWVQQTGASAGTYQTSYAIMRYEDDSWLTSELSVSSTDYSVKNLAYNNDRYSGYQNVRLLGRHQGNTIGNVTGYWNPQ